MEAKALRLTKGDGLFKRIRLSAVSYAMMAPFLLFFSVFTIAPVAISIYLSFTNFNLVQLPSFTGFDNFIRLFLEDDVFIKCVRNTLVFALITGPVSYVMCFVFAWFINELPRRSRTLLTVIFYAPSIAGSVYFIWSYIFSSDIYGLLNGFLISLGVIREPIFWLYDTKYVLPVIIIVQLWLSLGTGFLTFIAGMQSIDRSLYEAGAIDGVRNRFQELWYITVPSMYPQLLFGAVMQITASFSVADICMSLAGFPTTNYAADTIVTYIIDYGTVRFEMGYASSVAVVLFVAMIVINQVIRSILGKVSH